MNERTGPYGDTSKQIRDLIDRDPRFVPQKDGALVDIDIYKNITFGEQRRDKH